MATTSAISNLDQQPSATARQKLSKAADEVVGQIFYGTLLRQVRSESLKGLKTPSPSSW